MKWFRHFTNAHDNGDLTKVRMKYGADGYAIYWYCLELVAGELGVNDDITFELKHDADVIGFNLQIDSKRVEEIMHFMVNLGLFEDVNGIITCLKLAKYLDKKTTRNSTIHAIIDAASVSGTVGDKSGLSRDCPGLSPLDTDTYTDIPNGINAKAWAEFERHRKDIRKPLTELARKKNLAVLERMTAEDQQACVDATIANRWTGLFARKEGKHGTSSNSRPKSAVQRVREANGFD